MRKFDVIILGAGGAGLFCAIQAGKRGRKVLVLDHSKKVGGKILISGGGRCNFTNKGASFSQYYSQNPHFMKSAFARFTPLDFIQLVEEYKIPYHEKKLGQLFCSGSAEAIVQMLEAECGKSNVEIQLGSEIQSVEKVSSSSERAFQVKTQTHEYICESLVVATGGLSLPKLGASDLGYKIARQFGLKVTGLFPALDGFVFSEKDSEYFQKLAGVSTEVILAVQNKSFQENILFTHKGLSGPASLQGSLYWNTGDAVNIDFFPHKDIVSLGLETKEKIPQKTMKSFLGEFLPQRLCEVLCELKKMESHIVLGKIADKKIVAFLNDLKSFNFYPERTVGYSKAEVTRGGVDTVEISSQTMEVKKVNGLYFVGEVVDVTGWLGGYNFQWAWASGWAAGQVV